MKNDNIYHDTGETLFKDGNFIFLNDAIESSEPHLHVHDFIEISYVASGTGIHILGEKEYEVRKGDLFLINYHIPHEFRSYPSDLKAPLTIYNCVFKPDFIDVNLIDYKEFSDVIQYLSFRSIFSLETDDINDVKILGGENSELEAIFEKMLSEYRQKKAGYLELLRVYLIELLIKLFRVLKSSAENKNGSLTHHARLIEDSMQYLKQNYMEGLKLNELASKSFLSPTYFCKLFKDYTGITVSEYIQRLRIEEACHLLVKTNYKVIAIAQMVGYKDLKHFNEIFKKQTGITPSMYRKR